MSPSGRIRRNWRREEAQTMAEYVVVLAVITPAVLLAFGVFSDSVVTAIERVGGFLGVS
jgi:Flp pilus assembly pilin Flp